MNSVLSKAMQSVVVVLAIWLSACVEQLDGAQFKAKLNPPTVNSAESWWVVGEDSEFYYLEDRLVLETHDYKVPKRDIAIDLGSNPKFPVNLKLDEVKVAAP